MNISNNISSMMANQSYLNNGANNIANSNTDGFIPNSTVLKQSSNDSVVANSRVASDTGSQKSQTDLNKEIPDQIVAQNGFSVNSSAIKTQDEMLGTLLDMKA
jgi:flagellar hook protein FlgE